MSDTIAGPFIAVWNRAMQVLADSGFRLERGSGWIVPNQRGTAYASDTARGVWIVWRFASSREDTVAVTLTAEALEVVFDPAQESTLDDTWKPHVEKLRRIDYGVFRWKHR